MTASSSLIWNENMILVLEELLNLYIICVGNLYKTAPYYVTLWHYVLTVKSVLHQLLIKSSHFVKSKHSLKC
jgi:hypothetical protein